MISKETIKKGNKVISVYELKVDSNSIKEVIEDIKKGYSSKRITLTVNQ